MPMPVSATEIAAHLGIPLLGRDEVWNRLPESAAASLDPSASAKYLRRPDSSNLIDLSNKMSHTARNGNLIDQRSWP
jgi:hypothetical protein